MTGLGVHGFVLSGEDSTSDLRGSLSPQTLERTETLVRTFHNVACTEQDETRDGGEIKVPVLSPLLVAHGGVAEPADAIRLYQAGADVVMIDSGFAEAGPGLPKRINAAAAVMASSQTGAAEKDMVPVPHRSWFWSFLLGLSLTIGGLLAVGIGSTRVVLPYDEEFLGMSRDEICGLNAQLLPFMSHDRVTLAGTMLALGPLYLCLAWFGDRRGQHWSRVAVLVSSLIGFLSFFAFLGFGYFDPFHAFISAILFQLMALGLRSSQRSPVIEAVDLHNSPSWKRALWGQLLMVAQGVAVLVAGITICSYGMTDVFVAEDLAFMKTSVIP